MKSFAATLENDLFLLIALLGFGAISLSGCSTGPESKQTANIILLAGKKSHGPGFHEYIKSVRLLKVMLDESGIPGLKTEIYYDGWPGNPAVLDSADLILTISDGQDGPLYSPVPFMTPERMEVMDRQMKRGCGLALIHFSTFASDHFGARVLKWGGGYFDWQDDQGERDWYSDIKTLESQVQLMEPDHPISNGLPSSFKLNDEYYYKIRFDPGNSGFVPLLAVPELENEQDLGNVVAWTMERDDGGRAFSTTTGHFYQNWKDDNYRKFILNGIVWASGLPVPKGGVPSRFYDDSQVTRRLYGSQAKGLILTGNNHPAHKWQETTPVIKQVLEREGDIHVDISMDIEDLGYYDLRDYDFLVMNYCNWEDSSGLSDKGKEAFTEYLRQGGGLVLIHFANGAFHFSLPGAESSDWPEFRNICRRIWDHNSNTSHDKYGQFTVTPTPVEHPITQGILEFQTEDELYYNQKGDLPIEPLLVARSKDTGNDEPMAWAYTYGEGKVFQTVLGHDVGSYEAPEAQKLLERGARWTMNGLE